MTDTSAVVSIALPELATASALPAAGRDIAVQIPDSYLSDDRFDSPGAEGFAIQRLITLAHECASLRFIWEEAAANRVLTSPSVLPLAAVAICLNNADHQWPTNLRAPVDALAKARAKLVGHRLGADLFSEKQLLVCLDHQRPSLPFDFYDPTTRRLRPEADFESLIDDVVFAQQGAGYRAERLSRLRIALAVILRELLENTDDHAKTDFDGSVLKPNAIRGVLLRRTTETTRIPKQDFAEASPVPCLEFTIFDSGVGYYNSYRRQLLRGQARGDPVVVGDKQADTIRRSELGPNVPIETEYAIVLKCLARHSESAIPDPRPGHRGMGLYEVLRALKTMQGLLEIRTGRIHGYRSFLEGELKIQMEPESSKVRPGMPKASLLDVDRKVFTRPAVRELVRGSVVRVVVPLV